MLRVGNMRSPKKDYRKSVRGIKQTDSEANHSLASSAEVCNEWSYTSAFSIRLHGVDREILPLFIESTISVTIM